MSTRWPGGGPVRAGRYVEFMGLVFRDEAERAPRPQGTRVQRKRKFTPEVAAEIRRRYAGGQVGYGALAREYGVCDHTIARIIREQER